MEEDLKSEVDVGWLPWGKGEGNWETGKPGNWARVVAVGMEGSA